MDRGSQFPTQPSRDLKTHYLIAYNLISSILWFSILGRVLLLIPLVGFQHVSGGVGDFAKWTQTLAVLDIVNSALGLVRSALPTTILQVSSRILLIWGICTPYASATTPSPFYSSMLVAWSISEVVRYSYFLFNLRGGVPGIEGTGLEQRVLRALAWTRYNMFYVLYPLGIGSECVLVWKASMVARAEVGWGLWVVLGLWGPGSYILYSHMIAQRRKMIRGKGKERTGMPA